MNIYEKLGLLIAILAGIAVTLLLWAFAIGALFPHTCIMYSAECKAYRMETCIDSGKSKDVCLAIVEGYLTEKSSR